MTEIEKLQAENERLKERADYLHKQVTTHLLVNNHLKAENDKWTAWNEKCQQEALVINERNLQLEAELSELKGKLLVMGIAVENAKNVLYEVNMGNYDDDEVSRLNNGSINAHQILDNALSTLSTALSEAFTPEEVNMIEVIFK